MKEWTLLPFSYIRELYTAPLPMDLDYLCYFSTLPLRPDLYRIRTEIFHIYDRVVSQGIIWTLFADRLFGIRPERRLTFGLFRIFVFDCVMLLLFLGFRHFRRHFQIPWTTTQQDVIFKIKIRFV